MFRLSGAAALMIVGIVLVTGAFADGGESVGPRAPAAIHDYGPALVPYATVRRPDGTYRRMLVAPDILDRVEPGAPLPEGTRILMETYYEPGRVSTVFHQRKVDGEWQYGAFAAGRPDLDVGPRASCLSCHARAAETDLVFTLASLWAVAAGDAPHDFTCDRRGRSPCAAADYGRAAAP